MTVFVDDCLGTTIKQSLIDMGFEVILHADRFGAGTEDVDWITIAAQENWLALTRDRGIKRRRIERQAVIEGPLKFFSLGSGNADLQTHIEVIRKHLISIKALGKYMRDSVYCHADTARPSI